ncbi:MAG: sulfatase, partial [Acidobacteria bacterium]|nr:sulfatase [Acidobacteriota bacterium]
AAEGTRFTRAYTTAPVCSASRSGIATGMYQTSIGAHNHRSRRTDLLASFGVGAHKQGSHPSDVFRLPDGVHVFTDYLRQVGYHTSNVITAAPGVRGLGKTDFNFDVEQPFDGTDWNQRKTGQPFYAQINFMETHRSFHRFPTRPTDPASVHLPPYLPDHPAVREDWAMYLDDMQHLDVKVGKVLDRLKQENLLDETIIFFFGDNGRPWPKGKKFLYEPGIHVPLIIRVPEKFSIPAIKPGSVSDDLISAIDFTAATLGLAAAALPKHFAGIDFLDPSVRKREYVFAACDRIDDTVDHVRSVCTKRFKYIRNFYPDRPYTQPNADTDTVDPTLRVMRDLYKQGKLTPEQALYMAQTRPPEELYDLETDQHELRNLASSAEHRDTLIHLREVLDRWIEETGDQGGIPEDPRAMVIPEELEYRKQVDGWNTVNYTQCRLTKAAGKLRVTCSGARNIMRRSVVTEGGELTVRFLARSNQVAPKAFIWDSVTDFDNPANRVPISFTPDGKAHECVVSFKAEGHLATLQIDFGEVEGELEFDWIRLYRKEQGKPVLIAEFNFSS